MKRNKFSIQDKQYDFPYHYLTSIENNIPSNKRVLQWGFQYLTYMYAVNEEIRKLEFKSILDVGCGDGFLLNNLQADAYKYGIDLSEKAIGFAKAFSKDAVFEVKDIKDISQNYDLITLIEVLEHVPDDIIETFLLQISNLLEKNKHLIITVPTTVLPLNKKHFRHYNEEILSSQISKIGNLELVRGYRVYKKSFKLKMFIRLLNNSYFSINLRYVLYRFWKWHIKNNLIANKNDGCHIVQIYKRI